jgi:hypothetical protein
MRKVAMAASMLLACGGCLSPVYDGEGAGAPVLDAGNGEVEAVDAGCAFPIKFFPFDAEEGCFDEANPVVECGSEFATTGTFCSERQGSFFCSKTEGVIAGGQRCAREEGAQVCHEACAKPE